MDNLIAGAVEKEAVACVKEEEEDNSRGGSCSIARIGVVFGSEMEAGDVGSEAWRGVVGVSDR